MKFIDPKLHKVLLSKMPHRKAIISLLTLSQRSPGFYRAFSTSFLKTLSKKQKFFNPIGELSVVFIKFEITVCKLFEFGRMYNLSFGITLTE